MFWLTTEDWMDMATDERNALLAEFAADLKAQDDAMDDAAAAHDLNLYYRQVEHDLAA